MCFNHYSASSSTVLHAKVEACLSLQVKSVFVDGLQPTWNEEKVKEHFGKFGEIERVVLACNIQSAKRKDFGFVNYTTREAAIACIEAFSKDDELIDGDSKVCYFYCPFSKKKY
jgi:RNA recognition motif-containing protein